jgi:DNA-binding transcriptional MerR regulator
MAFTIGEFSRMTGLTIKTLRFYHEQGVLVPACTDPDTGYRYYTERQLDRARVVVQLRALEFSLEQIGEILANCDDESDILIQLEQQKAAIATKARQYRNIVNSLDRIIHTENEARMASQQSSFEVEEKTLAPMLVAGVRMKGKYSDCSGGFAKIGRSFDRHIAGKPLMLHYDCEYKENDADFEACMPVRKAKEVEGVSVRQLPGGRCVTLMHKGPYDSLGRSYAKITTYIKEKKYEVLMPTREVYIKGPGMIFRGNPKNYLTEIQMLVKG